MTGNNYGLRVNQCKRALGSRDHPADRSSAEKQVSGMKHVRVLKVNEYVGVGVGWPVVFQREALAVEIQFALFKKSLLRQSFRRGWIKVQVEGGDVLRSRKPKPGVLMRHDCRAR